MIVVSAMGHSTDELIGLAHQVCKRPPAREMDMLLTTGERISMALLTMALLEQGVPAVSFTGSQTGIITDESHRRAKIRRILGDRVRDALALGKVVIVAGFQGVSESKEITTLGRGGSDTTAVALAAKLGAERCEIYTDVDGVYSADPRVVPAARLRPRVSQSQMAELAVLGAGVLHPRSVEMARRFGVRLSVLNSLKTESGAGTEIVPDQEEESKMEGFRITAVTSDAGQVLVSLGLSRPTVLTSLWETASGLNLQITAPIVVGQDVYFFASRDSEDDWKRLLQRMAVDGFLDRFEFIDALVPVSLVGERFSQDGSALAAIFDTLARENIAASHVSASALALTLAVPRSRAEDAVRALHERMIERDPKA